MSTDATAIEANQVDLRRRLSWRGLVAWIRRPMLVDVGLAFLLTKLLFYGAVLVAYTWIPEYSGTQYQPWHVPASSIIDASWRWDSGWYEGIVAHGYRLTTGQNNLAFFPLYPLLVRIAVLPLSMQRVFLAGVLVSNVALLGALIAVWLYAESYGGRPLARRALYLLAIFPSAFFFSVAYSESVFLLVAAWTLVLLRRGRFALAGTTGFLAALARPPGLLVGIPFLIESWQQSRPDPRNVLRRLGWVLLVPAGLAAFVFYLWWTFGDPLLFLRAQDAWYHTREFPLFTLIDAVNQSLAREGTRVAQLTNAVNTGAALLALVAGIAMLRWNLAGALFVLAGTLVPLAVPVSGTPTNSMARFVVVLFPLFVPLARWAARRPVLILLTIAFLPLQILLAVLFVRWYWVI